MEQLLDCTQHVSCSCMAAACINVFTGAWPNEAAIRRSHLFVELVATHKTGQAKSV